MYVVFMVFSSLCVQLDYTHDPIADFINAVQSDVIKFGSQRRYV